MPLATAPQSTGSDTAVALKSVAEVDTAAIAAAIAAFLAVDPSRVTVTPQDGGAATGITEEQASVASAAPAAFPPPLPALSAPLGGSSRRKTLQQQSGGSSSSANGTSSPATLTVIYTISQFGTGTAGVRAASEASERLKPALRDANSSLAAQLQRVVGAQPSQQVQVTRDPAVVTTFALSVRDCLRRLLLDALNHNSYIT